MINPVETTFNPCASTGMINRESSSATIRLVMPNRRGTENPQMSASIKPTRKPRSLMAMARLTLTDDFPTPPLPELTAITRVVGDTWVGSARWRAFSRALDISSARWRLVMAVVWTTTSLTPGKERALRRVSPSI